MSLCIAREELPNGYLVSTVESSEFTDLCDTVLSMLIASLGDVGWAPPGKPFETAVFNEESGNRHIDMVGYDTREEALEGHEKMVAKWREMPPGAPGIKFPWEHEDGIDDLE